MATGQFSKGRIHLREFKMIPVIGKRKYKNFRWIAIRFELCYLSNGLAVNFLFQLEQAEELFEKFSQLVCEFLML